MNPMLSMLRIGICCRLREESTGRIKRMDDPSVPRDPILENS
jgi:hypothetical protein